jgi:RecG-like helicase
VTTDDGESRTIDISGTPRSYRLLQGDAGSGELTVEIPEGIQAYSFTFG